MEEVISVSVYEYGGTVLVELVARDGGEPLAVSYEFDAAGDATLRPRETLEDDHATPIRDALSSDGYTVEE
jgi:hypothetical protein